MTTLSLLGKCLKSDEVISFLEEHDIDVVYAFDRLSENSPDVYWATAKAAGLELRFNERQVLDTIFCYVSPRDGFAQASVKDIGVAVFDSQDQAAIECQQSGARFTHSDSPHQWLKVLGSAHDVHYQFTNGQLSRITLMLPQAPG